MQVLHDGIGRGMFRFPFHDRHSWGHTGGIDAFEAMLGYFPDDGVCLALASNGGHYDNNAVAITALSLFYGLPHEVPEVLPIVSVATEQLESYVGTYVSDAVPLDITVWRKEAVLWAQATDQPEFPLTPSSDTEFRFDPAGVRMVFEVRDDGSVGFTLHQGGTFAFERQE